MTIAENIKMALNAIKGSLLRTIITCLIITLGITALVGMLTAIDGLEMAINKNFAKMGANTFNIRDRASNVSFGRRAERKQYPKIDFRQANIFKKELGNIATVSVSAFVSFTGIIQSYYTKTNPNSRILAVDENYALLAGDEFLHGRNFTQFEADNGTPVAVIGYDIAHALFPDGKAIDSAVFYQGNRYNVVGVLNKKGGSMGFGGEDRVMYMTLFHGRQKYLNSYSNFLITTGAKHVELVNSTIEEARVVMRKIRKLSPAEKDNFEITKSDALANKQIDNLKALTITATFIAFITLFGAAIGLMNIMLVSVTERTKEIGTRKALGATKSSIKWQFLSEALVICQLGGLGGIVLGISIGNIVGLLMGVSFIIPWPWILLSIGLCFLTGLIAGIYPAIKAAKLDPIEALRYE
jgi:putative ABC transport system permease protein